jgi:Raf kinase inhibitor-like YbhB/YbcL family protein
MLATAFVLASTAFRAGGTIPAAVTCSGPDRSPPLRWSGVPAGTRAFAIVLDDPDAKGGDGGTFVHWLGWNLPGSTRTLAAGGRFPREGANDFGKQAYGGPCPPAKQRHEYRFRLYALNAPLTLAAGANRGAVVAALRGHVRGSATLIGYFTSRLK